jgi:dihydropteroate synthase
VALYLPNPELSENQAAGTTMHLQRTYPLPWGSRTFVMGVLNITPDSFSGDGLIGNQDVVQAALELAQQFVQAGADILDIGGESTRPGASAVDIQTELERVLPIIYAIRQAKLEVILSIDTYKATVARAALEAGADWINDVWALRADPHMAQVAAELQVPIILMHNRSKPNDADLDLRLGGRYVGSHYQDLLGEIRTELLASVTLAQQAGIQPDRIILDSGIGFGKTVDQNLELLNRQDDICALGYPVLLGPSRKSFIGYTLDASPEERLEGTAAAVAVGITRGVDIIRVHDVKAMVKVARMTDAIVRSH